MSQRKAKTTRVVTDKFEQRRFLVDALARTGANVMTREIKGHQLALVIPGDFDFKGTEEDVKAFWTEVVASLDAMRGHAQQVHDMPPPPNVERCDELASGHAQPTPEEIAQFIRTERELALAGTDIVHALQAIRTLRLMSSDNGGVEMLRNWYAHDVALGNAHAYPGKAKGNA